MSSAQASFEFTCTSFGEAMLWDCIFATASKMLEILRSPHLIKRATCAMKRQHGRRRVSCGRDATETTTCSFRREVYLLKWDQYLSLLSLLSLHSQASSRPSTSQVPQVKQEVPIFPPAETVSVLLFLFCLLSCGSLGVLAFVGSSDETSGSSTSLVLQLCCELFSGGSSRHRRKRIRGSGSQAASRRGAKSRRLAFASKFLFCSKI